MFKEDIQLKLSDLKIENVDDERNSSVKFLEVMLDEHIIWMDGIRTLESKIVKNSSLLHFSS